MANVYYPAPKATITGIMNESNTSITPNVSPTAFSNMLAFTFAKKGPVNEGVWANGSKLVSIFGDEVVDLNNEYTTHQSIFIQYANSKNNPIDIIRVVPSDIGPKPAIGIWAEYIHDEITIYERDPVTNNYILDKDGNKIKAGTCQGIKCRFFINGINSDDLGTSLSKLGSLSGNNGQQSKLIPLVEFQHSWYGKDGDNVGIRIYPALSCGDQIAQVSTDEMLETGFPFRLQIIRKTTASVSGNVITTKYGSQYVEGSFQPNAIHPLTKDNYNLFNKAMHEYSDISDIDAPVYPEIGKYHIYTEHVQELFEALNTYIGEQNIYAVNPFTGVDFNGKPYDAYEVLPPITDSFKFTTSTTAFLRGGSDGTLSCLEYDKAVRRYIEQAQLWDEHIITNIALHPYKLVVDSGFSLATKNEFIRFVFGVHKVCCLLLTPQDMMLPINDESKDASIIKALSAKIGSFPESAITTATRGLMVGRCGELSNTTYKNMVPLSYAVFTRIIDMFGSPTGMININRIMQVVPNKLISEFINLSYSYQGAKARQRDWDNGATIIEPYDQRQYQIPSYRSVYSEPTSILSDFGNVIIAVDAMHQLYRVWQNLTGIIGLTQAQIIERANKLAAEYTSPERYANLVTIVANNYLDNIDINNKFSWHSNAIILGDVPARNAEISVTSTMRS